MKKLKQETLNSILNIAIAKRFSGFELSAYAEICGGFIYGVEQWCTHNIDDIVTKENTKYIGWEVFLNERDEPKKVYIEKSILNYIATKCKDYKHIKNTFLKYVRFV